MFRRFIKINRTLGFGDVLWVEPVVRYLLNENKRVKVITRYPEAFLNYPSRKLVVKRPNYKKERWRKRLGIKPDDSIINLDGAYERLPKLHILKAYGNAIGIKDIPLSYPKIYLTEREKQATINRPYVVLHIERNPLNFRNIYGVDWKIVTNYLSDKGFYVVQISTKEEDIYGNWVKTNSFREVMSLIYNCSFFIGADSGPSHIAAAMDKPSIIFFGSVNPEYRHLEGFKGVFMQEPCEYAGCYHEVINDQGQSCKLVGNAGIPICSLHKTETVIEKIDGLLESYLKK